ncbi:MAG: 16S rRNA (guanine(527)-N(7))-methyltransferase RsmG [Clostridia bacterium]|nr:16S rRNA (guanine(527)-N(7))-methyltransferase RsmG [Clostridia bacterium]
MNLTKSEFCAMLCRAIEANDPDGTLLPYLTDARADAFYALTEQMLSVNAQMNLTAITEPSDILVKHYADCARIVPHIPQNARLCDVGTGGGFPSLPVAILRPDVSITAVDSTQKKLAYVAATASRLGLTNLRTLASRAEVLGTDPTFRESFDCVTARAVARMNVLCEWCLPLLGQDGLFLAMKGRGGMEEHAEAASAIRILGGETVSASPYALLDPFSEAEESDMARVLITVRKTRRTPDKYPRQNAQIAKKPL